MANSVEEYVRELAQIAVNWDEDQRVDFCAQATKDLIEHLVALDLSPQQIKDFINRGLIRVAVSADLSTVTGEYMLYHRVFDDSVSPDEFFELTNGGKDPEIVDALDELIDKLPQDGKFACCAIALAFLSADDKINKDELDLLIKLFA